MFNEMNKDENNQKIVSINEYIDTEEEYDEELSNIEEDSVDNSEKLDDVNDILPLPTPLVNYRNKNFLIGFGIVALGLAISISVKDFKIFLLLSLFSIYFLGRAIVVARHYNTGRIIELIVTCTGIKPSKLADKTAVSFRAESETGHPVYFKFNVPSRRSQDDYIVGASYVIYFDSFAQNTLIGSIQLGVDDFLSGEEEDEE